MTRLDDATFPAGRPLEEGVLPVGDGHVLAYETVGAPDGQPLVVVHGGPGGQRKEYYRRLVDPSRFLGLLYDQRGCGGSTPRGSLEANTTAHQIADLEALREHLGHERWCVLGGSWGSTLSLAYAQAHPDRVAGLVVSGVFLADDADRWWWRDGMAYLYPELADQRRQALESLGVYGEDVAKQHADLVLGADDAVARRAVAALTGIEAQLLDVWPGAVSPEEVDDDALRDARVFAHYDRNDYFLSEGDLLRGSARLAEVPGSIVAGRFDACTPPRAAYLLSQAWPGSRLRVVPCAGHRWSDPLLAREVVQELDRLPRPETRTPERPAQQGLT